MYHDALGSILGKPDTTGRCQVPILTVGLRYVFSRDLLLEEQSTVWVNCQAFIERYQELRAFGKTVT